jgi:hypothetical protein
MNLSRRASGSTTMSYRSHARSFPDQGDLFRQLRMMFPTGLDLTQSFDSIGIPGQPPSKCPNRVDFVQTVQPFLVLVLIECQPVIQSTPFGKTIFFTPRPLRENELIACEPSTYLNWQRLRAASTLFIRLAVRVRSNSLSNSNSDQLGIISY